MKLLQLTDIHLTTPGETVGGRDPNASFDAALAHALSHHGDAEALIITGDLSEWGARDDYERLKARIADLPMPVGLCIGNHDDRPTMAAVFPEQLDEQGFVQSVLPLSRGHAILLDTWTEGAHAGRFCADRAAWLDRALAAAPGPAQLFLHHNPIPTHLACFDEIMLLDHARLGGVVAAWRDKIEHIHFGHCHMPIMGAFHGAPISGVRGTNHASFAAFDRPETFCGSDLPESYGVIFADGASVTKHMIEFGYAGPIHA